MDDLQLILRGKCALPSPMLSKYPQVLGNAIQATHTQYQAALNRPVTRAKRFDRRYSLNRPEA